MDLATHEIEGIGKHGAYGLEVRKIAVKRLDSQPGSSDGVVCLEIGIARPLHQAKRGTCLGERNGACGTYA